MKYLILFFLFLPFLSTAQEKDTSIYYYQGTDDSIPMPKISQLMIDFQIGDYVSVVEKDNVYMIMQGVCEIEDGGKTRYGLIIEAVDGAASVQYVLLLPDSSNNTWEKLKNNQ